MQRLTLRPGHLQWRPLIVQRSTFPESEATPVSLITGSIKQMACNAIVKGKCPHRGFNLAQVRPGGNGEILCPMHGMRFNQFTGKGLPYRNGERPGDPITYTEEELWLRG